MLGNTVIKYTLIGFIGFAVLFGAALWLFGDGATSDTPGPSNDLPLVENLPPQLRGTGTTANITETIAARFAEGFIRDNREGPSLLGEEQFLNAQLPEEIVAGTLATEFATAESAAWRPDVPIGTLTVIVSSPENATRYIRSFRSIMDRNFSGLTIKTGTDFFETDFSALVRAYSTAFEELIAAPVPSDLAGLHRQTLVLLGTQANISAALKNHGVDPAGASIALQLSDTIARETDLLRQLFNDYISRNNISI